MNTLASAFKSEGLTGTAAEVRAALGESVILRSSRPDELFTIGKIKDVLGEDGARLAAGTLKAASEADPLVWAFAMKLNTTGIPFNDETTQRQIDQLAAVGEWPDEMRDAIKAIGIERGPLWQKLGLESLPSTEAIEAALVQIENVTWFESELEPLLTALKAGGGTLAATKTAIAELLA